MDGRELMGLLDALRAADEDIGRAYDTTAAQADDAELRELLARLGRGHRADASELADELRRLRVGARPGRSGVRGGWGTGSHGTGDQFGGGEAGGAGGFPSAGPSYSGGEDDLTTGE